MSDLSKRMLQGEICNPHFCKDMSERGDCLCVMSGNRIAELETEKLAFASAYMKAGGELGTMQHRIARQRRTLAKLYQHRHEKNKSQAARIETLEAALRGLDDMIVDLDAGHLELHQVSRFINAALAGGKKDEQP